MSKKVEFTIPGRLGGWKRAGRNFKQTFTPAKMRSDQAIVKWYAVKAMKGVSLFEGPLLLEISILRLAPKSWSKKKRAAAKWITGTPDLDNTIKLIGDALNGVAWKDDAQIAMVRATRLYHSGAERVTVHIEELGDA